MNHDWKRRNDRWVCANCGYSSSIMFGGKPSRRALLPLSPIVFPTRNHETYTCAEWLVRSVHEDDEARALDDVVILDDEKASL